MCLVTRFWESGGTRWSQGGYLGPTAIPPLRQKNDATWRTPPLDTTTVPQRVSNAQEGGCAKFPHSTPFWRTPLPTTSGSDRHHHILT